MRKVGTLAKIVGTGGFVNTLCNRPFKHGTAVVVVYPLAVGREYRAVIATLKKVIERLSRNLKSFESGGKLFENYLNTVKGVIGDKSILVIDGGDIICTKWYDNHEVCNKGHVCKKCMQNCRGLNGCTEA